MVQAKIQMNANMNAPMGTTQPNSEDFGPDLINRLRSADGPAERDRVLRELDELEARLLAELRTGRSREDFSLLEAAHLAVQASRDTLKKLSLDVSPMAPSGPLNGNSLLHRSTS
jgi:hypothetical protein